MPRKKVTGTTKKTTATKRTRTQNVAVLQKKKTRRLFGDYLRFGESYTSLVFGIIAVVIATVLLLSVFNSRQASRQTPEVTPTIAQSQSFVISPTGVAIKAPEGTKAPERAPAAPAVPPAQGKTYTVVAGDNLWVISEKVYKSGYNWVDIAKANKLADPNDIHVGNRLLLPSVTSKIVTVQTADEENATSTTRIAGTTYKIVPGDDLWDIAVRAYGDGYQWVKIAQANNYSNPNLIHVGNIIRIPR